MHNPPHQADPNAPRLLCPQCGYNVGPTSDWTPGTLSTCPECGKSFDAKKLSLQARPSPITGGQVVWHLVWPALVMFGCSVIPIVSLILMPVAGLILLFVNGYQSERVAQRLAYQQRGLTESHLDGRYVFIALLLWLGQAALMILAGFGGCTLILSNMSFH